LIYQLSLAIFNLSYLCVIDSCYHLYYL